MGKPQIPVDVEGRTYYGCCAMCKEKLNQQPAARIAQDPVTGEDVDKSKAVIVQNAQGKVLYFGSSNHAGWHIAQANEIAKQRHFLGLVSEQSLYLWQRLRIARVQAS